MHWSIRRTLTITAAGGLCLAAAVPAVAAAAVPAAPTATTATPIKHLVVIFQENVSFDHYFGTYPHAANTDGMPFHAAKNTPSVNGLTPALLTANPNEAQPMRLTPSEAVTCDQNHDYTPEQLALDNGLMDQFVQNTQVTDCSPPDFTTPGLVMDYYDGNTVHALWEYAQHFAMSDNFFDTEFGPSTPGALNLISGQTGGGTSVTAQGVPEPDPGDIGSQNATTDTGTVYSDPDPFYDGCSDHSGPTVKMSGQNIGDLLNAQGVTWAGSKAASRPRAGPQTARRSAPGPTTTSPECRKPTTARTMSRSSTTPRRPTRTTCRRPAWPRSGTTGRPTTSTT